MSMLQYLVKRVAHAIFVIWAVATTVFLGLRAIPGDPVRQALGIRASDASVQAVRAELGLNQPLHLQYVDWMVNIVTLDLGRSIVQSQEIMVMIQRSAPKTFSIGAMAILLGLAVSIPAGVISATNKNRIPDYAATVIAFLGISMPAFFIGILLIVIFGVWLNWLPVFGYTPMSEGMVPWFKSILLPAVSVGLPYAAIVTRMMRSSLLEELDRQYMRTTKAKGLSPRVSLYKHAIQNAMIPVVTVAGIQVAIILVGSVTVEVVFGIRGLGRLLVQSMLNHDYPVVQAVILLVATIMVLMNLIVDLSYTLIDPRVRYDGESAEH
jgi:peptide/nickel transport system permease protein